MDNEQVNNEENEQQQLEFLAAIVEVRKAAFKQIIFGLLWWMGSAIAMYFALSSTGDSVYWFGGGLGALFHWYRAFKMITATQKAGAKALVKNEAILIFVTAALVIFSTSQIVPEYLRINSPTIGTCWGKSDSWKNSDGGQAAPVACWSSNAFAKAIDLVDSVEACPSESTGYLDPSARESRITCLVDE